MIETDIHDSFTNTTNNSFNVKESIQLDLFPGVYCSRVLVQPQIKRISSPCDPFETPSQPPMLTQAEAQFSLQAVRFIRQHACACVLSFHALRKKRFWHSSLLSISNERNDSDTYHYFQCVTKETVLTLITTSNENRKKRLWHSSLPPVRNERNGPDTHHYLECVA